MPFFLTRLSPWKAPALSNNQDRDCVPARVTAVKTFDTRGATWLQDFDSRMDAFGLKVRSHASCFPPWPCVEASCGCGPNVEVAME